MQKIIITCAGNMSDATYDRICRGFTEKLGESISFKRVVNDSIIGGFIADVDGQIYDLSISTQLSEMKKQISV